jgi:hypothetical protein
MNDKDERISIELTQDEALVLFELLSRFSGDKPLMIEDQAEQRVLWDMTASLEKELVQPFQDNYAASLEKARAAVRDNAG